MLAINIVANMSVTIDGVWIDNWIYRPLTVIITSNCNIIAKLHILHITTAHATPTQSAFTSRFPVTHLNNGDTSTSVLSRYCSANIPQLNSCSKADGHLTPNS
jgi:hypothetical protein